MIDASGNAAYTMIFAIEAIFAVAGVFFLFMCLRTVKNTSPPRTRSAS